jgi:hypothetical protein
MHDALHGILIGSVCRRDVEKHMISEGIFAQGIEEEAVPLTVQLRQAIEDAGHQSTKVLKRDSLCVERSSEGLCVADDEHTLGLVCAFDLCIGRCLLALLRDDALCIGLGHGEQVVVATGRVYNGSKTVASATNTMKARLNHTMI